MNSNKIDVQVNPKYSLDDELIEKIENTPFQPIFICGLSRSGTSILHKILVETGCFNYVSVYDIANYDNLIYYHISKKEKSVKHELNELFKKHGIENRGVDAVEISANSPEEYGFILYNKTSNVKINTKNISLFFELSKKIHYISENNKPLLLKNAFDIENFLFIKKFIPNARFIFIHRHPFNTLTSLMNFDRFMLKEKPFYNSMVNKYWDTVYQYYLYIILVRPFFYRLSPLGLMYMNKAIGHSLKYFLDNIKNLSKEDYINLKYEDLCENTTIVIKKILNFLNVKSKKESDYDSMIKPRSMPLDPAVAKMKKYIYKSLEDYFDYNDYPHI